MYVYIQLYIHLHFIIHTFIYTYIHTFIYTYIQIHEKYIEECKLLSLVMSLGCVLHEVGQEKGGGGWISFLHL